MPYGSKCGENARGISKGSPELVFPAYGGEVGTRLRLGHEMLQRLRHPSSLQFFPEIQEQRMVFQPVASLAREDEEGALKIKLRFRAVNCYGTNIVKDHSPVVIPRLHEWQKSPRRQVSGLERNQHAGIQPISRGG